MASDGDFPNNDRLLDLLIEIRKVPVNSEGLNTRLDAAIADMERVRYLEMLVDQEARIKQTIADRKGARPECHCEACDPIRMEWVDGHPHSPNMRMILCETCGNKRCPHATDHRNACTNSNEPGQKGSSWENVLPWRSP